MEGVGCSNIELVAMGVEKGIRGGGDRGTEKTGFARTCRPAIAFSSEDHGMHRATELHRGMG
jgi:hypothetical protein